jgi:uncharacterized protein
MEFAQRKALALALSALIFAGAAAAHDEAKPRVLTVSGEGEVNVAPDRADIGLAVEASEKTLADAEGQVSDGIGRLLKLCETLGIPRSAVRSAQLTVQPQYEYGGVVSNRPQIVGYLVSRQLDVDLKDLSKLGRLLQGAVEGGANRITGPSFGSSKKDEHQRAALALAAEDARANAQTLAKTLGVKLGRLHSLAASESGSNPTPVFYAATRMKAGGAPAPEQTYEPGEIRFTASVMADFDLTP